MHMHGLILEHSCWFIVKHLINAKLSPVKRICVF